ncbi:MAG: DUF4232 domain-containing protein [Jatrophihabitans sp.]|uniref:DUF4232 domain-containing protein n=1 Tax=Jatrophihabitans sp. TaxID=1932789 RepID=UPI003F7F328E
MSLVRGGAIQHQQLAGIIFTNTAASPCSLLGFPTAQLVKGGALIGSPARPAGAPGTGVVLGRNASAQAQLTASTDCNAPLSDHVRVRAPGATVSTDLADTLRACTLTIGPVTAG